MRSSRCSSKEKFSSGESSSKLGSSSPACGRESTSSFWWQRVQNSSSSALWEPQTWQNTASARVLVETAAGLSTEAPGVDHPDQQRAGAVLGVAEAVLEHTQDVEADVEPNQIGERQRAHG